MNEIDPSLTKPVQVLSSGQASFEVLPPLPPQPIVVARARALPSFDLATLLEWIPPIELKQQADRLGHELLTIRIVGKAGVEEADRALAAVEAAIDRIVEDFSGPTSKANELHKRMTGLRGDFCKVAVDAIAAVKRTIVSETQRLKREEDAARAVAQAEADREAKRLAKETVLAAKTSGASKEDLSRMREAAKTVTAAPVSIAETMIPVTTTVNVIDKRKARLIGTAPGAEPNPKIADMTATQQERVRELCRAIGAGTEPLALIEINWTYANGRANKDGSFKITGFESYNEGATRAKRVH